MAQALLAAAGAVSSPLSDDNKNFIPEGKVDLSGSRLAQLLSLAEAESQVDSQHRILPKPSPEDELLVPVVSKTHLYLPHSLMSLSARPACQSPPPQ